MTFFSLGTFLNIIDGQLFERDLGFGVQNHLPCGLSLAFHDLSIVEQPLPRLCQHYLTGKRLGLDDLLVSLGVIIIVSLDLADLSEGVADGLGDRRGVWTLGKLSPKRASRFPEGEVHPSL